MTAEPHNPRYVELQVTTNFTFLQGAAHPEELAAQAGCRPRT